MYKMRTQAAVQKAQSRTNTSPTIQSVNKHEIRAPMQLITSQQPQAQTSPSLS